MKMEIVRGLFICVLCLVWLSGELAQQINDEVTKDRSTLLFKVWQTEHGKEYKSLMEEARRFKIFHVNVNKIMSLNAKYRGQTRFTANRFADMSEEEFQSTVLMSSRKPPKFPKHKYMKGRAREDVPDSFDWRDQNKVSSVKDQGSTGTCWAFSTIGNIEGQWAMIGRPLTNLSVEQIVDCDGNKDPAQKNADCGVFGGWPYLAYEYVKEAGGIESEADYPYCCGVDKNPCLTCPAAGYNKTLCGPSVPYCNMSQSCAAKINNNKFVKGLNISDWKAISDNETEIASQLMKLGPLSVALDASGLQFYHSGVYNPFLCNAKELNHAVLMVGFGVHKGLFGSTPYWLIKNSWGAKWGQHGYFWIKRGVGKCGINTQVTTAVLLN